MRIEHAGEHVLDTSSACTTAARIGADVILTSQGVPSVGSACACSAG